MNQIENIIRDEITRQGAMPFARFMELALYHPQLGYYEQPALPQTGRKGDFYTSVSVGPLFGELLAWHISGAAKDLPGQLDLVEAGAHAGHLARDILSGLQQISPETYNRTRYVILDPSPVRRKAQAETLSAFSDKVTWLEGIEQLTDRSVNGFILSNELLDAFPVHRIGWSAMDKAWFEWRVAWPNDKASWLRTSPSDLPKDLSAYLPAPNAELAGLLPDGFTTEICPAATDWWRKAAGKLAQGQLLTFDYGLEALDFLAPSRPKGTLRAYKNHKSTDDVLANAGEQDLTAHINFTAIREVGEAAGLQTVQDDSQARFLTQVLAKSVSQGWQMTPPKIRQFQTLAHPEHLGRSFRVLGQTK